MSVSNFGNFALYLQKERMYGRGKNQPRRPAGGGLHGSRNKRICEGAQFDHTRGEQLSDAVQGNRFPDRALRGGTPAVVR